MRKLFVAIAVWGFSLLAFFVPAMAQDAGVHDLECFTSMKGPETSPDERTRWAAAAVATFYLGRLDQMGLTLEQIQNGVEKIITTPKTYQQIQRKEFVDQCLHDVNERVKGLVSLEGRGDARMLKGPNP